MIGKTISHYKILEKIGEGGMGVVYKAQDAKLDRLVALKFLPEHLLYDPTAKARFIQEAKGASAINHPNITTVYEIDEIDGKSFIAMELIEGKSLKTMIEGKKLPVNKIIDIAIQACEGLNKAHRAGIVHRDIKSDNILIDKDDLVKILDFGLAKLKGASKLTQSGTTTGTVAYMSPEQAQGNEVDQRTDLWSLGVVLYEMLTGKLPFRGEYEQAIIYSILNEEPEPVTGLRSTVPVELEQIVDKSLAKNANLRYENADELLRDLRQIQESLKATSATSSSKSIAVLPLENISPDKENEYFSDGLTEEIIMNLSKIKNLKVISRTSAMHYKGTKKPLKQIAKELQVQYVLEGSVRKQGSDLRITAQLIDAVQDTHLWAETYRGTVEDVFDIQEKVAGEIAEALKLKLSPQEQRNLEKRQTENTEAYQLYLKGRYYWNKRTEEGLKKGIEYFEQAIEKDPAYALAYVGLADCYNIIGFYSFLPPKEVFPKAKAAASKALEIDAALSEAYTSLGYARLFYDWDWLAAEKEFKKAIELNPNYASAHQFYGLAFVLRERFEEAIAEDRKALELDPLSLIINAVEGWANYYARRYDEAEEQLQKVIEMDPSFFLAHFVLSFALQANGKLDRAIAECRQAVVLSQDSPLTLAYLGYTYAVSGNRAEAERVLADLNNLSKRRYVSTYYIAVIYVGLGENDRAFEWLEKAYEERARDLVFLRIDPHLDSLRSDPRFAALLRKVGLEK